MVTDEAHVWRIRLDVSGSMIRSLFGLLSPDETERASRFRFDEHRRRFIARRGVRRVVLGRYLSVAPSAIRFCDGEHGKPMLDVPNGETPIQFNASHSGELALVAVTRRRRVGVDLEQVCPQRVEESLPQRFFAANEAAAMAGLPPDQKIDGFFSCWTRKEAFVKATGQGLSAPLDRFEVSLVPGQPARLLAIDKRAFSDSPWTLHHLCPAQGYAGALVVEGGNCRVLRFEYDGAVMGLG